VNERRNEIARNLQQNDIKTPLNIDCYRKTIFRLINYNFQLKVLFCDKQKGFKRNRGEHTCNECMYVNQTTLRASVKKANPKNAVALFISFLCQAIKSDLFD
jgi:hypothetical protein